VIDGLTPTKLAPAELPDLFAGDRLELFGRYAGEGAHAIRLRGTVNGARREYVYEASFPRESAGDTTFVPALWAERRVAALLDTIRLNGPNEELVGEVERLGREYRIVTPYTSHLVVEPGLRRTAQRGPGHIVPPGGGGSGPGGAGPASGPLDPMTSGGAPSTPGALASTASDTGSEGWFLGAGQRKAEADFGAMADELVSAGVLPSDAPREELVQLARLVTHELRESESRLGSLGDSVSGQRAVDDSVYLAGLMRGADGGERTLLELFTRRVQDRTFVLRAGVWTEQSVDDEPPEKSTPPGTPSKSSKPKAAPAPR
jgi:hypothetical protein